MKTKFIVNLPGCLIAGFTAILFTWLTILAVYNQKPLLALLFAAFSLLYILVAGKNGATVRFSETGIALYVGLWCVRSRKWEDIKEIGVLGTKAFASPKAKKHGNLYIYFSERKMTEVERFELCLKWPPKKMIYHGYSITIKDLLEKYWQKEVVLYNASEEEVWMAN